MAASFFRCRHRNECPGKPVAKSIINELLGNPGEMMDALTKYTGIFSIAEKLSSK